MNQSMSSESINRPLRHATLLDFPFIKALFKKHKDVFPHVRMDRLQRMIERKQVILDDGVLITYVVYKRKGKVGEFPILKGECKLNQIISTMGNGGSVIQRFFKEVNTNVFLTVRKDNTHAMTFYEKNGMIKLGEISWSNGVEGVIYKYERT